MQENSSLSKNLLDDTNSVCIDIALGTQKHRITLFANSDAAQIASAFAKEH